jgi:5-methylcytosine-specific restriction endonuclease McrA
MAKRKISRSKRLYVYHLDQFKCISCGSRSNLTIDHLIPRSKGGSDHVTNLVTRCKPCNIAKADQWPSKEDYEYARGY